MRSRPLGPGEDALGCAAKHMCEAILDDSLRALRVEPAIDQAPMERAEHVLHLKPRQILALEDFARRAFEARFKASSQRNRAPRGAPSVEAVATAFKALSARLRAASQASSGASSRRNAQTQTSGSESSSTEAASSAASARATQAARLAMSIPSDMGVPIAAAVASQNAAHSRHRSPAFNA